MPQADLSQRPKFDRFAIGSGLGNAPPTTGVDRDGGEHRAGLITGMAVITRGPALGHGMWIDSTTLQQTADLINTAPKGTKSRFTHPGLSGDGAGKLLGRAKQASVSGDIVRADLHFTPTSHKTPDGNLAEYVMGLAVDDPEAFGTSIAFEHDIAAENAFVEANGGKVLDAEYGIYDLDDFKSPDPANAENTFHVRLKELRAVDFVDEPAANPSGLFHRGQEIPSEADALCAYALGVSDTRPASAVLGIDPDRLRGFASRFLSYRGLSLAKTGEGDMPKPQIKLNAETEPGENTATTESETPSTPAPSEAAPSSPSGQETSETANEPKGSTDGTGEKEPKDEKLAAINAARTELSKFIALDPVDGPKWFTEGKTFSEAQGLAIEKLKTEKETLSTKLAAVNRGEKDPVSFSATDDENAKDEKTSRFNGLTPGQSLYASGILLPGRN